MFAFVSAPADTKANTWGWWQESGHYCAAVESRLISLCYGRGPSDTPESVHRGCGRQHEVEQLCRDDAKAGIVEVQAADCIVLTQLLHRNPAHRPTRCAGDSCEQQLAWWLTLALDAAAQGHTAEGGIVVVVIIVVIVVQTLLDSGRLQRITALLEQMAAAFGLEGMADERRDALLEDGLPCGDIGPQLLRDTAAALEGVDGVADFATLLRDLKWFDSPLPMTILAEGVAQLLRGKSADALRTLLVANDDLEDHQKEAALREPLFAPPAAAPPLLARSGSLAFDGDDPEEGNMMVCLKRCDAQTLCQLKAVSAGWQQRARRALFGRRSDVEVDVEELQHIGRLAAARQMPNLARLRGYGFTVELQAVGQADLEGEVDDNDGSVANILIAMQVEALPGGGVAQRAELPVGGSELARHSL